MWYLDKLIDIVQEGSTENFEELVKNLLEYVKDNDIELTERREGCYYYRTVAMPAGYVVVGEVHKTPCTWVMSSGDVITRVTGEQESHRHMGETVGMQHAGQARLLIILEDTTWTTTHYVPLFVVRGNEYNWLQKTEHAEAGETA